MVEIDVILLVGAVVLIAAIVAARLGARIGLPALLLFLGLGMLIGSDGRSASRSTTPTSPRPWASPRSSSSWPRAA